MSMSEGNLQESLLSYPMGPGYQTQGHQGLVARPFTAEPSPRPSNSAFKLLNQNELGPTARSSAWLSGKALCCVGCGVSLSVSAGHHSHRFCLILPQSPHLRTKPMTLTWKTSLSDQLLFGQHFHRLQKERPPSPVKGSREADDRLSPLQASH